MTNDFQLVPATAAEQLEEARTLFREYAASLGFGLDFQGFEQELAGLPGDYAAPQGCLLLAWDGEHYAGCVALHPLAGYTCEMKRLYVRPAYRGRHLGRTLADAVIAAARRIGYTRMKLDTVPALHEAIALYRSIGFRPCAPYRHNPIEGAIYMELDLSPAHVFKVSGTDLDDPAFSRQFAAGIAAVLKTGTRPLIVHGGGKELTALLKAFQLESRFVDGLRVTDAPTRDAALMTLSGLANKRLVAALLAHGVDALGVSGVDAGLVRVEKVNDALQFVGKPVGVRAALLRAWLEHGIVPVIAPMSIGVDGDIYNVNADHVAGAVAAAMDAAMLTFITNVPGVLDQQQSLIPNLSAPAAEALIRDGTVSGGMIPKVRTALEALDSGVRRVRITNLAGVDTAGGTTFTS
ncbi:MAG: acetylglutamate kinase [Chloroflexi bacterium]|nr:acetylglutamate kinase [Chloroflexota bacterium]